VGPHDTEIPRSQKLLCRKAALSHYRNVGLPWLRQTGRLASPAQVTGIKEKLNDRPERERTTDANNPPLLRLLRDANRHD
jgi:hypothetical protein